MVERRKVNRAQALLIFGSLAVAGLGYLLFPWPIQRIGVMKPIPNSRPLVLRDGRLLYASNGSIGLYSAPLTGGKSTPLFPAQSAPLRVSSVTLLEKGALVLYSVEQPAPPRPPANTTTLTLRPTPVRWYFLPFDGSRPTRINLDPKYRWTAMGETCFGVSGQPEASTIFSSRIGSTIIRKVEKPKPPVDLVVKPLIGGAPHKIASLPASAAPFSLGSGAGWYVQDKESSTLFGAFPPDYRPVLLAEIPGSRSQGMTQRDGRIYWIEGEAPNSRLVSVATDGRDRRVIAAEADRALRFLGEYEGGLYYVLSGREGRPALYLLDRQKKLVRGPGLPQDFQMDQPLFDGDYLYYGRVEADENWFDWSYQGLQYKSHTVLYRIRLPR